MGLISFIFGNKGKKIKAFVERGAIIIDVRTKQEFNRGAIPGSKNIPLQQIATKASQIKKWDKPIILCCASGMRSGSASGILKSKDIEAMNGGGWISLSKRL